MRYSSGAIRSFVVQQNQNTRYDDEAKADPKRPSSYSSAPTVLIIPSASPEGHGKLRRTLFLAISLAYFRRGIAKLLSQVTNEQTENVFSAGTPVGKRKTFFNPFFKLAQLRKPTIFSYQKLTRFGFYEVHRAGECSSSPWLGSLRTRSSSSASH
jgi:hypothetical protein